MRIVNFSGGDICLAWCRGSTLHWVMTVLFRRTLCIRTADKLLYCHPITYTVAPNQLYRCGRHIILILFRRIFFTGRADISPVLLRVTICTGTPDILLSRSTTCTGTADILLLYHPIARTVPPGHLYRYTRYINGISSHHLYCSTASSVPVQKNILCCCYFTPSPVLFRQIICIEYIRHSTVMSSHHLYGFPERSVLIRHITVQQSHAIVCTALLGHMYDPNTRTAQLYVPSVLVQQHILTPYDSYCVVTQKTGQV